MKELTLHPSFAFGAPWLKRGDIVLDYETDGLYWRTSKSIAIVLIIKDKTDIITEYRFLAEQESDEYDMLVRASALLERAERIITYNGSSFDIPHMKQKLKAYGLPDPFPGKAYLDLYLTLRETGRLFGLPSRRLSEYADILLARGGTAAVDNCRKHAAPQMQQTGASVLGDGCDAEKTVELLSLTSYQQFLEGSYTHTDTQVLSDRVLFRFSVPHPFPVRFALPNGPFYLICESDTASLSAKLDDGRLRLYHRDVENYEYLPLEGCAIHKSLAAYVEKKHKKKAVRENCFTFVSLTDSFLRSEEQQAKYISSSLRYLLP